MKTISRIFGSSVIIFIITFVSTFAVNSNKAMAITGESFTITKAMNSTNVTTWNLNYSEAGSGIKILVSEKNGTTQFTVRSKFFEVAYIMNKNGFGARMVKGSDAQVPSQILSPILNEKALNNQRVITAEPLDNETALQLIASYLPDLINNSYKYLIQ